MSRIYEGGQSQNSYKGKQRSVKYSAEKIVSDEKKIQQEGAQKLRDLKTQAREAQRSNQMSDMERQGKDRVDVSTLKIEQMENSQLLAQEQMVEKANMATAQMAAKADLTMQQTTEKAEVNINQLNDKSTQRLNHLRENQSLKLEQMRDKDSLRMEHAAIKADMSLASTHMQLSHQVDNANMQLAFTAINSLIKFGAVVGKEIKDNQEQAAKEDAEMDPFDALANFQPISASGQVSPIITEEAAVQQSEVTEERAIQSVAPGDTRLQEALRQPQADASAIRRQNQSSTADLGLSFDARLADKVDNPETMVFNGQGISVPLGSLNTSLEYDNAIRQLTAEQMRQDGITRADGYTAYTAYGKKAMASYKELSKNGATQLRARRKLQRSEDAINAGASFIMTGDAQAGWDTALSGNTSSGQYDGKSQQQINDGTLKSLMERLPDNKLPDVLDIKRYPGSKAFRDIPRYEDMITDEIRKRNTETSRDQDFAQKQVKHKIAEVMNVNARAQMEAKTGEESEAARDAAILQLKAIGGPQADDEIVKLEAKGRENINVYNELLEGFTTGNPPTTERVAEARVNGEITHAQKLELERRGEFGDVIDRRITGAGLQEAQKEMEGVLKINAANYSGVKPEELNSVIKNYATNLAPEYQARLRAYVIGNPKASPADIAREADSIKQSIAKSLGASQDEGRLKYSRDGGFSFEFRETAPVHSRPSPITGLPQRVYSQTNIVDIPGNSSINDVYLTTDEIREAGLVRADGGKYSPRIRTLADRFNVSPKTFVDFQLQNTGYEIQKDIPPAAQVGDVSDARQGMQALEAMGVPRRGAAYLSGNIQQESSWNGQQQPWGAVLNDGSDRNGGIVSWMDDAEKNHFRLRNIEGYLGKPIQTASTGEQIDAMLWEMKTTPYYQSAYRHFMNPNATDVQLRQASFRYWGYGAEESRYLYAEQLLR
jgi:hypothetical protein